MKRKKAVNNLRGRTPSSENKLGKYESNKTKQTKSKSKSVKKSAKQIKTEQDSDGESDIETDIKSHGSYAALKNLVKKELVNLGLQAPDSTADSSSDSSSISESSDYESSSQSHQVRLESIKRRKSRVKSNLE